MSERLLYYWARLFSSSLLQGQRYAALPPTIMIVILGVTGTYLKRFIPFPFHKAYFFLFCPT
ncbi:MULTISPECIES: PD-(D/E)XK nuclease family transposase [Bacillaceae]|uniref:PD-(D/E)XK nuclease family transposase n=1 Tax=unclassified Geobacillus TaxID=2642459 RepID=UPI0009B8AFA9|nr:hypothetical protein [Geobacillus sp. DSP4a]PJW13014.1 hypothetical protein CV945_16665 [Geobacillus sp. Manikaran-105]PJW16077.1 hypothetical protein CV944_16750 [Geobacillus sp. WSUCF-018B]QOR83608.1 PD-(D/E)XK nuclease family transposase [Geobacillus stearothermophilus]